MFKVSEHERRAAWQQALQTEACTLHTALEHTLAAFIALRHAPTLPPALRPSLEAGLLALQDAVPHLARYRERLYGFERHETVAALQAARPCQPPRDADPEDRQITAREVGHQLANALQRPLSALQLLCEWADLPTAVRTQVAEAEQWLSYTVDHLHQFQRVVRAAPEDMP